MGGEGGTSMCVRGEKTVGRRNLLGGRDTIRTKHLDKCLEISMRGELTVGGVRY